MKAWFALYCALFVALSANANGYVAKRHLKTTTEPAAVWQDPTPEPFRVPDRYLIPFDLDARRCTSQERNTCGDLCGIQGMKSCTVGTSDGQMTMLCVCHDRVNLNLYVKNATNNEGEQPVCE